MYLGIVTWNERPSPSYKITLILSFFGPSINKATKNAIMYTAKGICTYNIFFLHMAFTYISSSSSNKDMDSVLTKKPMDVRMNSMFKIAAQHTKQLPINNIL